MSDFKYIFREMRPTGSRVICNPAPMDTDEDFICLIEDSAAAVERAKNKLLSLGFKQEGMPEFYTGNNSGEFRSWRRGETNLIITKHPGFFKLFLTATELARRFNLQKKADRIALFQAVLYGVSAYDLEV